MQSDAVKIKPVSKDLIYMKVADVVSNYIRENNLQPGDKIPAERVLAEQLKTGRNSVREALRVLENEGIIEVKMGKGTFVASKSSPDSLYMKLIKVNYRELLDIKLVLEREAVRHVAISATPEQLAPMEEQMNLMEKAYAQGIYAKEEDRKFHNLLLELSGNRTMAQLIDNLILALDGYAGMLDNCDELWIGTIPYHRQMLDAMRRHDLDGACRAYDRILEIDILSMEGSSRAN